MADWRSLERGVALGMTLTVVWTSALAGQATLPARDEPLRGVPETLYSIEIRGVGFDGASDLYVLDRTARLFKYDGSSTSCWRTPLLGGSDPLLRKSGGRRRGSLERASQFRRRAAAFYGMRPEVSHRKQWDAEYRQIVDAAAD